MLSWAAQFGDPGVGKHGGRSIVVVVLCPDSPLFQQSLGTSREAHRANERKGIGTYRDTKSGKVHCRGRKACKHTADRIDGPKPSPICQRWLWRGNTLQCVLPQVIDGDVDHVLSMSISGRLGYSACADVRFISQLLF